MMSKNGAVRVAVVTAFLSFSFLKTQAFSATDDKIMQFTPLRPNRLNVDPSDIVQQSPRLAKDRDYANAVQQAWKAEDASPDYQSESCPLCYGNTAEGEPLLYGHLVRRREIDPTQNVPGIIFFHTGAGPHDIFLHWKADMLVTKSEIFPHGAVVLIADILSDASGWAWESDRTRYNQVRQQVLTSTTLTGDRPQLQQRIQAALQTLTDLPQVDSSRLAAFGWCLGGHSILELSRMAYPGMCAMVTFHGVFDGIPPPTAPRPSPNKSDSAGASIEGKVLVCNGAEDPFVSPQALQAAMSTFARNGHSAELLDLETARHGFTNPAQDFNPNAAFRYDKEAANRAWAASLELFQSQLNR